MLSRSLTIAAAAILSTIGVQAAYSTDGPNVMYYWGQNSAGGWTTQESLATYCKSGLADAILLSFLNTFNVGGLPGMNLANACTTTFAGTSLLSCPQVEADIKTCQSLGVKIILSLGGAAGSYGFSSDAQGTTFAQTIWDMFGGGSSSYRPFGTAQIDGVDLDIEGGPSTGYATMVKSLRSKFDSDFIIGAAPQCPFPDAILGSVIDAAGFDYVNIQFYNNYCSAIGNSFNFDTWANWATTTSPNSKVKVYFTTPGSTTAAGTGYADMATIKNIVPTLASSYSGVYGGVTVWDASQAWNNGDFASDLYSLVHSSSSGSAKTTTTTTTKKTTTTTKTTTTKATTTTTTTKNNQPAHTQSSSTKSTTTAKTTTTKTTTTAAPAVTSTAPAPSSGTCVTAGQACSTNGQYVCTSGGKYAVCDNKKWSMMSCPSSTTCIPTADGSSMYCGYSSGSKTCPVLSARARFHASFTRNNGFNRGGAVPKPYSASNVNTQFVIDAASPSEFSAVINARRLSTTPFKDTVTIQFTAPKNVKVTKASMGKVRQTGNKVRIQVHNNFNESMAIVVDVKGTVKSGVFVAPNPSSLRIK